MGGGKSSGSQQAVITPEQTELLKQQTKFLTETAFPAYQQTIGQAKETLDLSSPSLSEAAKAGYELTGDIARAGVRSGAEAVGTGMEGLKALFDPNYERGQVQAALQTGREAIREQLAGQNAMHGAAGSLGSARQALALKNLQQLGEQRQTTAAAGAQAQVQSNRAAAAQALMGAGQSAAGLGLQAAGQKVGMAGAPLDLYGKYASIVYGTPQQSITPSFAGTQGQTTSGKGMGFRLS